MNYKITFNDGSQERTDTMTAENPDAIKKIYKEMGVEIISVEPVDTIQNQPDSNQNFNIDEFLSPVGSNNKGIQVDETLIRQAAQSSMPISQNMLNGRPLVQQPQHTTIVHEEYKEYKIGDIEMRVKIPEGTLQQRKWVPVEKDELQYFALSEDDIPAESILKSKHKKLKLFKLEWVNAD
jgi:hypothetical protein